MSSIIRLVNTLIWATALILSSIIIAYGLSPVGVGALLAAVADYLSRAA